MNETTDSRENAARPSQSYIDTIGHYRNLAISLGAKPEQMLNTFDRDLCRRGLDFECGDYTVDDSCGDLAEVWDEVDQFQTQLADRNEWCDHLATRESALLLAVPRPFRTFIHRRAERIQRKLEAQ